MNKSTIKNLTMESSIHNIDIYGISKNNNKKHTYQKESPVEKRWKELYASLTPHQKEVFDNHYMDRNIVIKGDKGTGKTYLLEMFIYFLRFVMNKKVLVLAPTHKSADELKGETVHSVFSFSFDPQFNKNRNINVKRIRRLFDVDAIVINDCNKLRVDYFDSLCKSIKKTKPSIQLIISGNFDNEFPIMNDEMKCVLERCYQKELQNGSPTEGCMWDSCDFQELKLSEIIQNKKTYQQVRIKKAGTTEIIVVLAIVYIWEYDGRRG